VLGRNELDSSTLQTSDLSYTLNNIREEYDSVVELALSGVSINGEGDRDAALDGNLTLFSSFVANLTAQQHIVSDITAGRLDANATYMNASVNITLKGLTSQATARFYAVSEIRNAITQLVTCTSGPNVLDFRVRVLKEYLEPVVDLTAGNFTVVYDGGGISPSVTHEGAGVYLFESSTACAGSDSLSVTVIDNRNIKAAHTTTT